MGAREGESLSRQAATPLKPGGSAISSLGLGDTGDDVKSDFSCMAHLCSSALQCWALLPHTPAAILLPQLIKSWRGPPSGDHQVGWMQHLHPAREVAMGHLPLYSLLMPHKRDIWLLSWLAECGHQSGQFLSGLLCGGHLFCRHLCRGQLFGGLLGGLPILAPGYPLAPQWWGSLGSPLGWVPRFILLGTSPEGCALQDGIIGEGHIWFHHLPQFLNTPCQKEWSAWHWQISLLCPILEGLCIGQSHLGLSLSKVLVREHQVWKWWEFLLADAFGGRWCQIVILDTLGCALYSGDFKRGPYLWSELLEVIYPQDPH